MYQILPVHWIVAVAVLATLTVLAFLNASLNLVSLPTYLHFGILAVDLCLLLLTWKPIWLRFWNFVPGLNSWFPDLNGHYNVELRHNWPIHQHLLEVAPGRKKFDPGPSETKMPEFARTTLCASIDAGFYGVHVEMWSEDPNKPGTVIDRSRTLATILKRPCDGQPHRLIYVYQQKNRRDRRATTDDSTFEGAAILDLRGSEPKEFSGEYWTNRAWHQGLSTAGLITFRKRDSNGDG